MDPSQFPANSNAKPTAPAADKKVEQVTTSPVVHRKTPLSKRFLETFVVGNSQSVVQYVFFDVIVPALKDVATDVVTTTIERMLYGEGRSPNRRTVGRGATSPAHTAYNRYSGSPATSTWSSGRRPGSNPTSGVHNMGEIILGSMAEANEVMDKMFELTQRYNQVTLRDLYDLVGRPASFTDDRWGWTDISDVRAVKIREGYLLELPRPIVLD